MARYDIQASGIGRPRSTLGTFGWPTQMSACDRSMGIEVMENRPSSKPHCRAMSRALKPTARTPGKKRCRSYQRVEREYDISAPPPCMERKSARARERGSAEAPEHRSALP